jgi:hypothetical protein
MIERERAAQAPSAHQDKGCRVDIAEILIGKLGQQGLGFILPTLEDKYALCLTTLTHSVQELVCCAMTEPHANQRVALADDMIARDQTPAPAKQLL